MILRLDNTWRLDIELVTHDMFVGAKNIFFSKLKTDWGGGFQWLLIRIFKLILSYKKIS